ncbi:MAG: polyprenyl diphosphate synthase [Eubacteriales bacterium]|nr:polyprenyl diphosphate synthase [Eubacteriales bacterium]
MEEEKIPQSIAIIMDGNGRYAKKNNLPIAIGHKNGCDNLEVILEEVVRLHIKYFTVYAFSTENWKRSKEEVNNLMSLFHIYMPRILKKALNNNVKIHFIGDIESLDEELKNMCYEMINQTKNMTGTIFSIAFNYGSRNEIIRAIKKIKIEDINNLDEEKFSTYLDTNGIKDPDLLIRTSGECRLSNFLLWQISYSEIYITNVFWPEFSIDELHKALSQYSMRERRYGTRV